MGVVRPVRLIIDNYPKGQVEWLEAINNPEDESAGTRQVPFSKVLYVDREDFREEPPPKYWRLYPGNEVRLRYAYFVKCTGCEKDADGEVSEIHCTYDPETRGGDAPDGRKVKATLHWVSASESIEAEVRLYDYLFTKPDPLDVDEGEDWKESFNPDSLEVVSNARLEPSLADAEPGSRWQLERIGYFCVDPDSESSRPVLNRTVGLRDTWKKIQKRRRQEEQQKKTR